MLGSMDILKRDISRHKKRIHEQTLQIEFLKNQTQAMLSISQQHDLLQSDHELSIKTIDQQTVKIKELKIDTDTLTTKVGRLEAEKDTADKTIGNQAQTITSLNTQIVSPVYESGMHTPKRASAHIASLDINSIDVYAISSNGNNIPRLGENELRKAVLDDALAFFK